MKLPWVSRTAYERLVAQYHKAVRDAAVERDEVSAMMRRLARLAAVNERLVDQASHPLYMRCESDITELAILRLENESLRRFATERGWNGQFDLEVG